jgi:DNA replication protein DnaC
MELREEENFYMKQKTFFLTFPHCNEDKKSIFNWFLVKHKPDVILVAKEKHKDGDYHFHIWLEYKESKTIRNCNYFDFEGYHCNIGKIRKTECNSRKNVIKYMMKEDKDILNFGCDLNTKNNKRCNIALKLMNGETLLNIINTYPEEYYNYEKLRKIGNLYKNDTCKIGKIIKRACFWIYGPTGIGKSMLVRESFDEIYEKSNSKWWDGYSNEEVVLLDDFDRSWVKQLYNLKIWCDIYRFNAEIKGSIIVPSYKKLIITSNYSIEELLQSLYIVDEELINAIKRRVKELYFKNKEDKELIKEQILKQIE